MKNVIKVLLAVAVVALLGIFIYLVSNKSTPAPQTKETTSTNDSKPGNYSLNGTITAKNGTVLSLELPDHTKKDIAYTSSTQILKQTQSKTGLTFESTVNSSFKIGTQIVAYSTTNPNSEQILIVNKIIITK